jgi:hypothetical protein
MNRFIDLVRYALSSVAVISSIAFAADKLDELTVMALGPVDGRAVVKMADGKMQVLTDKNVKARPTPVIG